MDDTELRRLLPQVRAIAREAGQVILRYYVDRIAVGTKQDGSPVTAADTAAEHVILPALLHLAPGVPVVAEEAHAAGRVPDVSGGTFWLVDPLDGTREFVNRSDEFTVNVALVRDGVPVLGVIHAPALGQTYAAAGPGTAVFCEAGHSDRPIAARRPPPDGIVAVASRSHGDEARLSAFLAGRPVREVLRIGSSLKFGLLARGDADLYPRFGETSEWDTAAGHAVLAAAGGTVARVDGAPLVYGKPGFLNPAFVATGPA